MFDHMSPKILDSVKPICQLSATIYEDGSVDFEMRGTLGEGAGADLARAAFMEREPAPEPVPEAGEPDLGDL